MEASRPVKFQRKNSAPGPRTGLARALSKLGYCSRREAWELIEKGRVSLNGKLCRNPEQPVSLPHDAILVDGIPVRAQEFVYVMLNKPRGLITTTSDEKGRDTVFECFKNAPLPRLMPVGRLDQASEGLLLFTNDTKWADGITNPTTHLDKTYHVQINRLADATLLRNLKTGRQVEEDFLAVKEVTLLREGEKNSWLEVILDEGKNRHIRRLLSALDVEVLRLIRIAIGPLQLGNLPKGSHRRLNANEVEQLNRKR